MYQNMQLWLCKIPSLRKEIWVAQNKLKCHDEPAGWASGTEGQTPRTQFPPPPLDPLDATRKAQGWLESEGCAPALLLLAVTPVAVTSSGLPRRHSSKEPAGQYKRCKRRGFDGWVWKILLEEEMATHSSILAWRIPWTEEPGWL